MSTDLEDILREHFRREREGSWPVPVPSGLFDPEDPHLELLMSLRCPTCDQELTTAACSPVHALLQDSPLQHPLLLPLFDAVVQQIRHDETKICTVCRGKVPIATGDCPHVVDRWGQVWMSKKAWEKLVDEVDEVRNQMAEWEDMHSAYVDAVALERKRAEDARSRWAAEWALEKFSRICGSVGFSGQPPSNAFQKSFEQMLMEDL